MAERGQQWQPKNQTQIWPIFVRIRHHPWPWNPCSSPAAPASPPHQRPSVQTEIPAAWSDGDQGWPTLGHQVETTTSNILGQIQRHPPRSTGATLPFPNQSGTGSCDP
ncbi:hypothetical protein ACLOJK_014567, partial [Asimina triloba]